MEDWRISPLSAISMSICDCSLSSPPPELPIKNMGFKTEKATRKVDLFVIFHTLCLAILPYFELALKLANPFLMAFLSLIFLGAVRTITNISGGSSQTLGVVRKEN